MNDMGRGCLYGVLWAMLCAATVFARKAAHAEPLIVSDAVKTTILDYGVGDGKTLPRGLFRGRFIYKIANSDSSFSDFGGAQPSGFKFKGSAAAAVIEYGMTPSVSFQLLVPTVFHSQLALDGNTFSDSSLFRKHYNSFLEGVAERLVENGLCENVERCIAAIDKQSLSMPYDKEMVLENGETLALKQGIPIKTYATPFIVNSVVPSEGRTGIGDVETGLLVSIADPDVGFVRDWTTRMSLGLGVRWATGSFYDVPRSQRATGRGVTDVGLRVNFDRPVSSSVMVSVQHQSELMLFAGKKRRPSLIQSTELNKADPNAIGADGIENDARYTRKTPRHLGFMKCAWHAGSLFRSLEPLIINSYLKYDLDHPGELGGKSLGEQSLQYAFQFGLTISRLQAQIPMQLDVDYEMPISGQNKVVAAQVLTTSLKTFYRF